MFRVASSKTRFRTIGIARQHRKDRVSPRGSKLVVQGRHVEFVEQGPWNPYEHKCNGGPQDIVQWRVKRTKQVRKRSIVQVQMREVSMGITSQGQVKSNAAAQTANANLVVQRSRPV